MRSAVDAVEQSAARVLVAGAVTTQGMDPFAPLPKLLDARALAAEHWTAERLEVNIDQPARAT